MYYTLFPHRNTMKKSVPPTLFFPIIGGNIQRVRNSIQPLSVICSTLWQPSHCGAELGPYLSQRLEISLHEGCILWGSRAVVPVQCQLTILHELHEGHPDTCTECQFKPLLLWPLHPWAWHVRPARLITWVYSMGGCFWC